MYLSLFFQFQDIIPGFNDTKNGTITKNVLKYNKIFYITFAPIQFLVFNSIELK